MPKRPIVHQDIDDYLHEAIPARDPILAEMEDVARQRRFPIVGPLVGTLFFVLARARRAQRVFEMGSGFGYSTLWFARAVGPGGLVVHTEGSAENSAAARGYLERAGLADRVRFHVGDARDIIRDEREFYDIVFCDIDKEQYGEVPDLALPRLAPGGLLIVDNALWYGRVCDDPPADDETAGVVAMTRALMARRDYTTTILPLRDGVLVAVKN